MSARGSRSEAVLALAEEFLGRYRRGERPSLKEYADRHPDLAADIRQVFPAMALLENIALADEPPAAGPPGQGAATVPAPLQQLGDYRLLREVGRGGMGVVYEAEQVSLGRHVALKVLPPQLLLDAKRKRRFEREARAAAKLHHTNIVPVFGVGEQDGTPYYVMQFIQGLGLDLVLVERQRGLEANLLRPAVAERVAEVRPGGGAEQERPVAEVRGHDRVVRVEERKAAEDGAGEPEPGREAEHEPGGLPLQVGRILLEDPARLCHRSHLLHRRGTGEALTTP